MTGWGGWDPLADQLHEAVAPIVGWDPALLIDVPARFSFSGRRTVRQPVCAAVRYSDRGGVAAAAVGYPGTFRDGEPARRAAVEAAVRSKLPPGVTWRAWWNPPANTVTFTPAPPMPAYAPYVGWPHGPDVLPLGPTDPDAPGVDTGAGYRVAVWDTGRAPHALVSGATGAGKTVALRVLIVGALRTGWTVAACDPKRIELAYLRGRHGVADVASDLAGMRGNVRWARALMESRYVDREAGRLPDSRPVLLVVDEATSLIGLSRAQLARDGRRGPDPLVDDLEEIARLGRRARVHLLIGMQRPDAADLPGELKRNLDVRLAVGPHDSTASRMVLDTDDGATVDPVKGRAVLRVQGVTQRVQTYWLADPADPDTADADRTEAERWLPPQKPRQAPTPPVDPDDPPTPQQPPHAALDVPSAPVEDGGDVDPVDPAPAPRAGTRRRPTRAA